MAKYKVTFTFEKYVDNVVDKYEAIEVAYAELIDNKHLDPKLTKVKTQLISE